MGFDAIVLAGGRSKRMEGSDKTTVPIGGVSLLGHVLAALKDATTTVVVGPAQPTAAPVQWTREQPAGGGPVAGLAAALPLLTAPSLVLLAADLPFIAAAIEPLLRALGGNDCAVLADGTGRLNYLAAAWNRDALERAVRSAGGPSGVSMRSLYSGARIEVVPDLDGWGTDCDTPEELEAARRRAEQERTDQ